LMVGPWLFRLTGDLSEERAARVRSQERADMAAHLHDSVLQTLALIQKHAGDGRTVATLARAQERDLRSWLYGDQPAPDTSVASALKAAAAEVEDTHGVPVEVVTVGDARVSEALRPLVLAAREAMVNDGAVPWADHRLEHGGGVLMARRSVVIVDDHAMFRTGVRAELSAHPDKVAILGEAADVDQAVEAVARLRPEVVLLDVHLPGGGGAEVMRRVGTRVPETRFLALSVSDAAEDVIGTIRSGARGYVTKTITGPELVAAIERVATGDAVFSPRLAGFVLDAFAGSIEVAQVDEDLDRLTEREREVMRLIARGYAYKEVASELFISIKTVETHVSSVLRKLQLSSRHELTRWASDRRLL
jgi:DNA-binding NarL/FixJ family response regulator